MSRKFIQWRWNPTSLAGHDAATNELLPAFHCDEEGPQT